MTWYLMLPVGFALLAGGGAGVIQRRLPPRWAALFLVVIAALAAVTAVSAAAAIAFGYLADLTRVADLLGWCHPALTHHDRIPAPSGLSAAIALGLMAVAALRARWRRHRVVGPPDHRGGIEVLACAEPVAYALPGKPGRVVVSIGMLEALTPDERTVLFAHEQAHLDHRHDRYVAVAEIAVSLVPLLRPLGARVRHATERWADEIAAEQVGDRSLVARAITRAALASVESQHRALALADVGVRARVAALLQDRGRRRVAAPAAIAAGVAVVSGSLVASAVQIHHLLAYVIHVCGG